MKSMCCLRHRLEDRGLGGGRRHRVDEHAFGGKLLRQRFRQRDQAGLRRAVVRGVRVAFLAGDRRDVDDAAVTLLDHLRHDRAAGQERPDEVDLDDAPPDFGVEFPGHAVAAGDAGVVDEDVDAAVRIDGRFRRRGDVGLDAQLDDLAACAAGQLLRLDETFSAFSASCRRFASMSHSATLAPERSMRWRSRSRCPARHR